MAKRGNRTHILMRYLLISGFILLFASAITCQLFSTTIIDADKWNQKALEELATVDTITPERGEILAADGSVLATNLRYYTLRLDYRSERFNPDRLRLSVDSLADSLALYVAKPRRTAAEWKERLTAPLDKDKSEWPRALLIARDISYIDMEHLRTLPYLNIKNRNRSGLTIESRNMRSNPYGDMARRSIGIVNEDSITGQYRGYSGLECALDQYLYGTPGYAKKVPLTHKITNWTDVAPQRGYDVTTTIDIKMQDILENELNNILEEKNAQWGVAVLMEVATGDIKAISNLERSKSTGKYIEGMNRAVLGFEPGSVVKTLSMLVALEDSIVTSLNEVIPTGGRWAYAGKAITDSHNAGNITVNEVLEHSSNIAMAKIITREYDSHPQDYYDRIERLGFFNPLNTGIAGERIPLFPKGKDLSRLALSRVSYGYATEIPPISTLALYNAIANGGLYVRPRLVSKFSRGGQDSLVPVSYVNESGRICSAENAAILRNMLRQVVEGKHGTARRLKNDYVSIAGKTGTSYMVGQHGYEPAHKRLTFCGFFPVEQPLYSCIVLVCDPQCDSPKGAAATSGEVLKNIALKMYSRGMLNNFSDLRSDEKSGDIDTRPTLLATANPQRYDALKEQYNVSNPRQWREPAPTASGTTPSVIGLGLREAVTAIENSGCEVKFNGSGFVMEQVPAPGTPLPSDHVITISLTSY